MGKMDVISTFIYAIVTYNIAILFGTLGEILTEKSGSLNLGVEGTMAVGAIGGYIIGCATNSLFFGMVFAFIFAGLCGLLFAFLTVTLQANQNVTGLTITTFGLGMYFFIGRGMGSKFPILSNAPALKDAFNQPLFSNLSQIPFVGKTIFGYNVFIYLAIIIAIIMWVFFKYTKTGLKLKAVGENPASADAAGVKVNAYKYTYIIMGSGIMGLGGLYMGLYMFGSFEGSNSWINGYGWIAIALVIFANWNSLLAILGILVFGFFNTLQIYGSNLAAAFPTLSWLTKIPDQFYAALPFAITAIVLIINSMRKTKNSNSPSAVGINYYREER